MGSECDLISDAVAGDFASRDRLTQTCNAKRISPPSQSLEVRTMLTTPYLLVLLGCPQGASECQTIATLPVAYASQVNCLDSRSEILKSLPAMGYARVEAECRPQTRGSVSGVRRASASST